MGSVSEARDLRLGNSPCAVKAMLDVFRDGEDAELIRRKFAEETALLSRLDHPGNPRVRDYFTLDKTV